ncbi:proteophosphoglycan 5 [Moniliophthora roreri MCA 2997]|uniref:Proteophosphoglycan 5 n=2 Tax=Moniliophthora roreri TaxID=221103 RepID=V2WU43_MONRO|nr:proteophosphoglycan 5 [Moniliophthora roreri MCA 2997]
MSFLWRRRRPGLRHPLLLSSLILFFVATYELHLRWRYNSWLLDLEAYNQQVVHESSVPLHHPPRILLVSSLFPLSTSKHTWSQYSEWLNNFVSLSDTPIYLFLPAAVASELLPKPLPPNLTINTTYNHIWDLPPVSQIQSSFKEMWHQDRERDIHGPELYAIWSAKPWFTEQGMKNMGGADRWDYVFWNDAGSFRVPHPFKAWPAPERIHQIWERVGGREESKIIFPIFDMFKPRDRYWKEEDGPIDEEVSIGSFFGGPPSAVEWYTSMFYAYRDHYISKSSFIGKDQTFINSLILLFPSRFIGIYLNYPHSPAWTLPSSVLNHRWLRYMRKKYLTTWVETRALGRCKSEYTYYQFFLADKASRSELQEKWLVEARDNWDDRYGNGDKPEEIDRCRLTEAISFEDALRGDDVFGHDWNPPHRNLLL